MAVIPTLQGSPSRRVGTFRVSAHVAWVWRQSCNSGPGGRRMTGVAATLASVCLLFLSVSCAAQQLNGSAASVSRRALRQAPPGHWARAGGVTLTEEL